MTELENPLTEKVDNASLLDVPQLSPRVSKSVNVSNIADAKEKISDIEVIGNGDSFQLLCKASSKSQDWMKSAKAYEIPGIGCLVQVTTQQGNSVAEALVMVEGVTIEDDINNGRKLVKYRRSQHN